MLAEPDLRLVLRAPTQGRVVLCATRFGIRRAWWDLAKPVADTATLTRICNRPQGHQGLHCDHCDGHADGTCLED